MKENLKIEIFNKGDCYKAFELFNSLRYFYVFADELYAYASDHRVIKEAKTISFDELRELARPKEYLNDKFELVVTNQPKDGFILVPDGAECFLYFFKNDSQFFYRTSPDTKIFDIFGHWQNKVGWSETSYGDISHISSKEKIKILWQRENKVGTVKGREGNAGRFLHQWAYEAFGRGEDVDCTDNENLGWANLTKESRLCIFDNINYKFRLKPQTIQIGSRTINKPISVKPEIGTFYYVPKLDEPEKCVEYIWADNYLHNLRFDNNLCHLTSDDAVKHTEATLELFAFQMGAK